MWEVHGSGAFTGGRVVTSTAGCHGGGEGTGAGCGGTGQPASATWPDGLGTVVVVGAGRATGCARFLDRDEASTGRRGPDGVEVVIRPEPVEAAAGVEPDIEAERGHRGNGSGSRARPTAQPKNA